MNFDEQLYQRIQRYLDAEMDAAEAVAFEAEVNSNPELAREVQLNVEMEQLLAETEENELRKSLQQLNAQFGDDAAADKKGGGYWRFLLFIIPLLLGGIWWGVETLNFNVSTLPSNADNQIINTNDEANNFTKIESIISDPNPTTEIVNAKLDSNLLNENPILQDTSTKQTTDLPTPPQFDPPPADFKVKIPARENLRMEPIPPVIDTTIQRDTTKIYVEDEGTSILPIEEYSSIPSPTLTTTLLDSLLQENVNQTKIQLTNVELPDIVTGEMSSRKPVDSVTFNFSGELIAATNSQLSDLQYEVYNYDQAYAIRQAIFKGTLPLQSLDAQTYSFDIKRKLALGEELPALYQPYYVVITPVDSAEILWVAQFSVTDYLILAPTTYIFDEGSVMITEAVYSFPRSTLRIPATITHQSADSTLILPLTGQLILAEDDKDILINLMQYEVYSFEQEDAEPLYSSPLPLIPIGGETHLFIIRDRLKLPSGNYYVLIKDDRYFTYGLEQFRVVD